jgi:hypothetical protein
MCDFFKSRYAFEVHQQSHAPNRGPEAMYGPGFNERQIQAKTAAAVRRLQRTEIELPTCPVHGGGPVEIQERHREVIAFASTVARIVIYDWACEGSR